MENKKKILHITPHLGGGVGHVLLNWITFDNANIHSVASLDYANDKAVEVCKKTGISLYSDMWKNSEELLKLIPSFDIILVHFNRFIYAVNIIFSTYLIYHI